MLPTPRRAVVPAGEHAAVRFVVLARRGEVLDGDLRILRRLDHPEAERAVRHDGGARFAREP
jgi:hypothetical protein